MIDPANGPLARFYEYGQAAAQRGEASDANPYRRADRRNAWVRGWHAGDDERLRLEAFREARRAAAETNLARGAPERRATETC